MTWANINGKAGFRNRHAWRVSPDASEIHCGSFINSHAKMVGSSLYSIPVKWFFLAKIVCEKENQMINVKFYNS